MTLDLDIAVHRDGFRVEAGLSVGLGETVALLGPNGAGKTTVVQAVAGLVVPARGRIVLDGTVLDDRAGGTHVPPADRPIGVVFQDLLLFPHLSAVENAAFPLRARGIRREEARRRAINALRRFGVAHRADARPGRLSGGEAQRVALARALVHEPRVILLDEPLSALDVSARSRIRDLLRETLEGFGGYRIVITHDPVEAAMLADRLVLLEAGGVTQTGTLEEIRSVPRTRYAADLVGVNLYAGRLVPVESGVGRLETEHGDLVVGWPPGVEGPLEDVLGVVRPADVSLFLARPEGSARNVLRGIVRSVTVEGERARVSIDSRPPLVAEVTPGSIRRLGLGPGAEVWASFKAVEVRLITPGE
jgi:molybdate transport system ATP-binding protein